MPIIRQLYSLCLLTEIEELYSRIIPENQQGFIKGGRIYASLLSLYALVEKARLQKRKLYVTYVDVKKAFQSAKRELLLQIFSHKVLPTNWSAPLGRYTMRRKLRFEGRKGMVYRFRSRLERAREELNRHIFTSYLFVILLPS